MKTRLWMGAALLAGAGVLAFASPDDYAAAITSYVPGPGGESSAFDALGAPTGGGPGQGSLDVATIGVGGTLTLEFAGHCANGPGTDLLVCENPFFVGSTTLPFAEACFVEVSSDNQHFARFPTLYSGPAGPFPPFSGVDMSWYSGIAGVRPVLANPGAGADPLDVVHAGGDAFDLADLADHPLVLSGDLNLDSVRWVRLVDIDTGTVTDDQGQAIWDSGIDTTSCADIDAVVAVNNDGNLGNGRPEVELSLDAAGFLTMSVRDPDGLKDIKQGLSASIDFVEVPFVSLLPFFLPVQVTATGVTWVTGPVPAGAFPIELRAGARDKTGLFAGDALKLP